MILDAALLFGDDPYRYPDNLPEGQRHRRPRGQAELWFAARPERELPGEVAGHRHRLRRRPGRSDPTPESVSPAGSTNSRGGPTTSRPRKDPPAAAALTDYGARRRVPPAHAIEKKEADPASSPRSRSFTVVCLVSRLR